MIEPMWIPSAERVRNSNVTEIIRRVARDHDSGVVDYKTLHRFSTARPEIFWDMLWDFFEVVGDKGGVVVSDPQSFRDARWFPQARLNFTENLLRRRDDGIAVVSHQEGVARRTVTWKELYRDVSRMRQALAAMGVGKGDRVVACLPNIPEAVTALLACASLGAIWCACGQEYAEASLVERIDQLSPKVLLIGDGYRYNGKTFDLAEKSDYLARAITSLERVIVFENLEDAPDTSKIRNAVRLRDFIAPFKPAEIAYERFAFNHPLFIMFTSGTTGKPKAIVHHAGGHVLIHLKDMVLQSDMHHDETLFWFSSTGWVIWLGSITALAWGVTVVLYEGSPTYPRPELLLDIAQQEQVARLRMPPPIIDSLARRDIDFTKTHDLSSVQTITSGGAPLLPSHYDYVYSKLTPHVHLSSPAGSTDVNTALVSGDPNGPVYRGETQSPALGIALDIFDDAGKPVRGTPGELVCTKPFPSLALGFWNDEKGERFHDTYFSMFPGIMRHGDWAEFTPRGRVILHGRSDATLKVNGVRMGTADIYRSLEDMPEISFAVAVDKKGPSGDQIILFVVLGAGRTLDAQLTERIRTQIKARTSIRHVPAMIIQAPDVPRSTNGKPSEIAVKNAITGGKVNEGGLENPEIVPWYRQRFAAELVQ